MKLVSGLAWTLCFTWGHLYRHANEPVRTKEIERQRNNVSLFLWSARTTALHGVGQVVLGFHFVYIVPSEMIKNWKPNTN